MGKFNVSDIYSLPEPESATATKVFTGAGREWEVTIETGGQNSAERWNELYQAQMYGQTQQQIGILTKKPYKEEFPTPEGVKVVLNDLSYIGSLKLLSLVIVATPRPTFGDLAIWGHRVGGKMMDEICTWAANENGVSEFMIAKMQEATKNALGEAGSQDDSSSLA